MKHFGRAFTELLFRSGLTQKAVGEKLGASHVTVTRWKDAETIDAATLEKVCRLFRVPITYFFDADVIGDSPARSAADEAALQVAMLEQRTQLLQRLVDEKERTIQILLKA